MRVSSGNLNSSFDHTILNVLHEDLHWLVLIAGKLLCSGLLAITGVHFNERSYERGLLLSLTFSPKCISVKFSLVKRGQE